MNEATTNGSGDKATSKLRVLLLYVIPRRVAPFKAPIVIWDLCPTPDWRMRSRLQDYVAPRVDGVLAIHSSQALIVNGAFFEIGLYTALRRDAASLLPMREGVTVLAAVSTVA